MNRQNVTEPEEDESESASDDEEEAKKGKPNPLKVWAKSLLAKTMLGKMTGFGG